MCSDLAHHFDPKFALTDHPPNPQNSPCNMGPPAQPEPHLLALGHQFLLVVGVGDRVSEMQVAARAVALFPRMQLSGAWILPGLGLLWGSSYLWIAILNRTFDPSLVILARVVAALIVLALVLRLRGSALPSPGRIWLHIAVIAVCADLMPLAMLIWSQHQVDSSVASALSATIPLFTLLIAAFVFRSEVITRQRLGGIMLSFTGVVILSGANTQDGLLNPAVVAVLVSSLFYGFGLVYARRYVRGDPFGIVALQMLLSLVIISPIALLRGEVNQATLSVNTLLAALALGGLSCALGYCLYYTSLVRLGPSTTSYATYLSPVIAIVLGWVILGERITPLGFLGIILIVCGIMTAAGLAARWFTRVREPRVQPEVVPVPVDSRP